MAFDAIKKLAEGVPDYLEVPVEAGLLDKATAIINGLGYDMEDVISIFLRRTIQTPHQGIDKARAEELIRGIANATLEDMATQPLLIPRRDVFGVELPDYAMPGFCSGSKLYFGSIDDIASFRSALYSDDRCKPEDMEFMSAKLYGAKYSSQAAGKCEHTNVWGFPYFAWWDRLESVHLWIRYKDRFLRCVRVRMTNLRIDTNEDASASYSPGEQLWGYPHILEYRQPYHFNRMYEVEKTYETEDSLLYDLAHYDGSIELTTWLDDLFGDG